jgi:hypothetical protein
MLRQQHVNSGARFKVSATPSVFRLPVCDQPDSRVTHVPTNQFTASQAGIAYSSKLSVTDCQLSVDSRQKKNVSGRILYGACSGSKLCRLGLFYRINFGLRPCILITCQSQECLDLYLQPSCIASYKVVSLWNHFIFLSSNEETSGN